MKAIYLILQLFLGIICSVCYSYKHQYPVTRSLLAMKHQVSSLRDHEVNRLNRYTSIISKTLGIVAIASQLKSPVYAAQGIIKPPTDAEIKVAVTGMKAAFDGIVQAEGIAKQKDWQKLGDLLSTKPFQEFSNNANVFVRSEALTPDEKKTLGTIKRYGTVADAIIMIGGLINELKIGGISVVEGSKFQESIVDEEYDADSDVPKEVNEEEVVKYIKLAKGSINDVMSIAGKFL